MHYSYRRLKSLDAYHRKLNRPCGRRQLVIHNHGVSSTSIHRASNIHVYHPRKTGRAHASTPQNKKGRPAEAGLPCKNLESRISAQQHRRNGKSIQCPSNVPVLMTITSLWALLCSVVLVPHNLGAFESLRNLVGNHVRFRAQMVQIDRKTQ